MSSLIIHIDMDAFFASIEQQSNPRLRGKPVVIGGRDHKYRSVICAASYEAKAFGIDSGMRSWEAFKLCPNAVFVAADTSKYLYTSRQIFDILKNFTPQVEMPAIDEFFLNVDNCQSLRQMALEIKKRIKQLFGITCSIGIAPTRLSAKLAAKMNKPDGLVILNKQQVLEAIRDFPVERLCGIGNRLKRRFNCLGIINCGQLAEYPDDLLIKHFGQTGIWLKEIARVEDIGDVQYYDRGDAPPKSVGHSQTLREVTGNVEYIKSWLYLLSEMVGVRLRRLHLAGKTVHLYLSDRFESGYSRQKTFPDGTCDGYEIYRRSLYIIKLLNIPQLRARVLRISVSHLCQTDNLYLFENQMKRDQLLGHLDKINDKFGQWTIFPASLMR